MRYPSPEDYVKAVQRNESFTTDELRGMELALHPLYQIPMPAAGTSAVVFKAAANGEPQALRFFTREDTWSGERYTALHEHFTAKDLAGSVAMPRWINDGIRVNGQTWPVVLMQWAEGHTLNRYVDDLVQEHDTPGLSSLAVAWRDLVARFQRAEFAHGDLQHGNVLVDNRAAMRLVDFDCSWIARFNGGTAPGETGHRNYQLDTRPWGRWMDTFSGLVIYISLLALSKNPNPWHILNTGENLLFRYEDFRAPFNTPTWAHLSSIQDRELDQLADRLKMCCAPGWVASGTLDELLAPREIPWWQRTQVTAAAPAGAATQPPQPQRTPPPPAWFPDLGQQPTWHPAQSSTKNWWKDPSGRAAPEPSGRVPRPAPSRTGSIIAVALAVGLVVAILAAAIVAVAGGPAAVGLLMGPIVATCVLVVGFARRR